MARLSRLIPKSWASMWLLLSCISLYYPANQNSVGWQDLNNQDISSLSALDLHDVPVTTDYRILIPFNHTDYGANEYTKPAQRLNFNPYAARAPPRKLFV